MKNLIFMSITMTAWRTLRRILFMSPFGTLLAAGGIVVTGGVVYTFVTPEKNAAIADSADTKHVIRPSPDGLIMSAHNLLGSAAMTAANIIITEIGKDGSIEYGIDIYQYKNENEFYLTTITRGKLPGPKSNILGSVTIRNNISTFENGEDYRHVAHVHSHPANTNYIHAEKFSLEDYHEACLMSFVGKNRKGEDVYSGPITMYLVIAMPKFLHSAPTLMRFTPPANRAKLPLTGINTLRGNFLYSHKNFIADNGLLSKTNIIGMGAINSYSDKNWVFIDRYNRWVYVNNRKVDLI